MKSDRNTVAICMAVYQGEPYIKDQIRSILKQTWKNWILFIGEEGSEKDRSSVVEDFCRLYPDRIIRLPFCSGGGREPGGPAANFARILDYVNRHYSFSYYMFADQDDYWRRDKILLTLKAMKRAEEGGRRPVLVHTDLLVADQDLKIICPSFFRYRSLKPEKAGLPQLLAANRFTGSTMMWNQALNEKLKKSLSDPDVILHDWWLALAASCFGDIVCLKEPTVYYRQHRNNAVGAEKVNAVSHILSRLFMGNQVRKTMEASARQAAAFERIFHDRLSPRQRKMIRAYAGLYGKNKIQRIRILLGGGYLKPGLVQRIGELIFA